MSLQGMIKNGEYCCYLPSNQKAGLVKILCCVLTHFIYGVWHHATPGSSPKSKSSWKVTIWASSGHQGRHDSAINNVYFTKTYTTLYNIQDSLNRAAKDSWEKDFRAALESDKNENIWDEGECLEGG